MANLGRFTIVNVEHPEWALYSADLKKNSTIFVWTKNMDEALQFLSEVSLSEFTSSFFEGVVFKIGKI